MGIELLAAAALASAAGGYAPVEDEALLAAAGRALFAIAPVRLSSVASCRGVGLTPADRTVGDFLGTTLSRFGNRSFAAPPVRVAAMPAVKGARPLEVTFAYAQPDDEEEWRWGVRFTLAANGSVVPGSIRCLAAG